MSLRPGIIFPSTPTQPHDEYPEKKQIEYLKERCSCCLLHIKTVFPFDLFPADISIDSEKVNIIVRAFFGSEQIHCIPIKNITDLSVEHSLFFATLYILPTRVFQNQVLQIRNLKKNDAIKARNLIQGLIIADRENVNIDTLIHTKDGIAEIENLGKPI